MNIFMPTNRILVQFAILGVLTFITSVLISMSAEAATLISF